MFNSENSAQIGSSILTAGERICVKAGECALVKINSLNFFGNKVVETTKRDNNLFLPDGIINNKTNSVRIFNTSSEKDVTIQNGQKLGYAYPCDLQDR